MNTRQKKNIALAMILAAIYFVSPATATSINNIGYDTFSIRPLTQLGDHITSLEGKYSDTTAVMIALYENDTPRLDIASISESTPSPSASQAEHFPAKQWSHHSSSYWYLFNNKIIRLRTQRTPGLSFLGINTTHRTVSGLQFPEINTSSLSTTNGGILNLFSGELGYAMRSPGNAFGRIYFRCDRQDTRQLSNNSIDNSDKYVAGFILDDDGTGREFLSLQGEIHFNDANRQGAAPSTSWLLKKSNFLDTQRDTGPSTAVINGLWRKNYCQPNSLIGKMRHMIFMGAGYRIVTNRSETPHPSAPTHTDFLQDKIMLDNSLKLTLGIRNKRTEYTRNTIEPMGILRWTINPHHSLWTAGTRLTRNISELSDFALAEIASNSVFTLHKPRILDWNAFDSKLLTSYEAGYRWVPGLGITANMTFFFNKHGGYYSNHIQSQRNSRDINLRDDFSGTTQGLDLSVNWKYRNKFSIQVNYTDIKADAHGNPYNLEDTAEKTFKGNEKKQLFSLLAEYSIQDDMRFRTMGNYLDFRENPDQSLSERKTAKNTMINLDIDIDWQAFINLDLTLTGKNLFNKGPLAVTGINDNHLSSNPGRAIIGNITYHF